MSTKHSQQPLSVTCIFLLGVAGLFLSLLLSRAAVGSSAGRCGAVASLLTPFTPLSRPPHTPYRDGCDCVFKLFLWYAPSFWNFSFSTVGLTLFIVAPIFSISDFLLLLHSSLNFPIKKSL